MITIDQLKIYRKYGGDIDGLERAGRDSEKRLFENNVWSEIIDSSQSIELISKGLSTIEFRNRTIQYLQKNTDSNAYAEMTKPILPIILKMKQELFQTFLESLLTATQNIQENYFLLPVAYEIDYVHRERAYCYELYSQIRNLLPKSFPFTLSGEINKAGHPLVAPHCGDIIPDFLVHNPGHMGPDDNLVIIEVKTIQRADVNREGEGLLKDIRTINCMTSINNGYFKGIILIFGSNNDIKKNEIESIYRQKCNPEKVLLLFHDNPMERARVL
jgi:hypothetical protein